MSGNHLVLIKIEGMHSHKCEDTIRKVLQKQAGVDEVEVDFATGQVSVLCKQEAVKVEELLDSVREAGYTPTGFTQSTSTQ